jgi:selenide,water dikinase
MEVVLLGGGHSHVQVLRSLGMRALRGARVTIVSREGFTPYSGMLPGHVAGCYPWRDIHIDLGPLARFADARLIPHEVVALNPAERRVELAGHPPLRYDVLSINIGAVPVRPTRVGIAVKPIGRFLPRWRAVRSSAVAGDRVVLVGGGAGGVELALAMRRALDPGVAILLLTEALLPGQNVRARRRLREALDRHRVEVSEGFRAATAEEADGGQVVVAEDGRRVEADHLFWVTGVGAPPWLRNSGLAVDAAGFVTVDRCLRSVSHPRVFAAGDAAALQGQPRPKAGVFAVRQGPVLADNLRRAVLGGQLRRYRPQRRFLTILGTADGQAVASRGSWAASGRWAWRWKDWIDRRFMARFNELPDMPEPQPDVPRALRAVTPPLLRCGGCGAKLGADPLRRVLARLPDQSALQTRQGVILGIGDDAAVLELGSGSILLTVDGFRHLVDDAYLFGRITAHHSLNDVFAMGGRGIAALAMATVPLMAEAMMEEELYQLLAGAVAVLNEHGVPLVGGHSAEGGELSLALAITGAEQGERLTKGTLAVGEVLVLTKALGTGVVFAAHMRGRAPSDRLAAAVTSMDLSNAAALDVLRRHGVRALTDVSGFGLLGHLGEMLRAAGLGATVRLDRVPLLAGACGMVADGFVSSLQGNNEQVLQDVELSGVAATDPRVRLLVDPQTSGGLLASLPAETAAACVASLRAAGYESASEIGAVTAQGWRVVAP